MAQVTSAASQFEMHLTAASSEQSALDLIADNCPLSKQKIKSVMSNGAVWLESDVGIHRIRRAKKILAKGNIIHFYYDERIQNCKPEAATLIADEKEFSIWNKPYGMYSQGTKWGDHFTIYRWAEEHLKPQRPAFLVHRLDRAASGLIILAHSKKMATTFSDMFKNHQIIKRYKAVVAGVPEFLLPHSIDGDIDSKPALSTILALEKAEDNRTTVTIEIETGRKHQIRKHLSMIGYPVIGDRLYGSVNTNEDLQLQSNYLKFKCPVTDKIIEHSI